MTKLVHILYESDASLYDYNSSKGYVFRGVNEETAVSYAQGKYLPTSLNEQMPLDPVAVEMLVGEDYSEMSQEDIDAEIQNVCQWYDGSAESVKGGLNTTSDSDVAIDYSNGEYVLVLKLISDNYCNFGDNYVYVQSTKDVKLERIYDVSNEKLYSPEDFLKNLK